MKYRKWIGMGGTCWLSEDSEYFIMIHRDKHIILNFTIVSCRIGESRKLFTFISKKQALKFVKDWMNNPTMDIVEYPITLTEGERIV